VHLVTIGLKITADVTARIADSATAIAPHLRTRSTISKKPQNSNARAFQLATWGCSSNCAIKIYHYRQLHFSPTLSHSFYKFGPIITPIIELVCIILQSCQIAATSTGIWTNRYCFAIHSI
jgi:hypothetical protein